MRLSKSTVLLATVFFLSGLSSLVYQVAWQRLLSIYYGVGPISTTIVVTVYMLGLGCGALIGGRLAERTSNLIRLYLGVEFLLGCFGLISLPYLDTLGRLTAASSYQTTFVWMFLFLCIPTLLMGMTLPLVVKILNAWVQNFLNVVSFLYFVNTIGAATGALVASYGLISFFGLDTCIYVAAALNFLVCFLILAASRFAPKIIREIQSQAPGDLHSSLGKVALAVVFCTGFIAIGYEVVWFRVIEVLVKASPYAFSTVLSVYLAGIALGSFAMHSYSERRLIADKRSLFFFLQFVIGIFVVLAFAGFYWATRYTSFGLLTEASFREVLHPPAHWRPDMLNLFSRQGIFSSGRSCSSLFQRYSSARVSPSSRISRCRIFIRRVVRSGRSTSSTRWATFLVEQ